MLQVPDDATQHSSSASTTPPGIYRDPTGVHGYLPKPGTAYAVPEYDFTDPDFVAPQKDIRRRYLKGTQEIEVAVADMRKRGEEPEAIARQAVQLRNQLKSDNRASMKPEELKALENRNIVKYGDPLGPGADQLFAQHEDWEKVTEKTMETDKPINKLLGLSSRREKAKGKAAEPQGGYYR